MRLKGLFFVFIVTIFSARAASFGPWVTHPSGTTSQLWSITDGSPRMVAVGNDGAIVASADGATWVAANSGVTNALRCVAFGNGVYLAAGTNGMTLRSTDGLNWTTNVVSPEVGWWTAMYAGTRFVLGGSGGTIATSTDGVGWSTQTLPGFAKMVFGLTAGAVAVAVCDEGKIFTSSGLVTWTLKNSDGSLRPLSGVAAGPIGYAAVGDNGTTSRSPIFASTDANTWAFYDSGTSIDMNAIAWGKDLFLAMGDNGSSLVSTNRTSWQYVLQSGVPTVRSLIYARGSFFAAGVNGFIGEAPYADTPPSGLHFDVQPKSLYAGENTPVTLTSHATGGTGTISYQWFKNGFSIPGATGAAFSLTVLDGQDAGAYHARATAGTETVFSNDAEIIFVHRPVVTMTSPADGAQLTPENPILIAADVTSEMTVTNVSFFNGTNLLGSDAQAPYQISVNLQETDYTVRAVAWNQQGIAGTSAPISFHVQQALPKITVQPLSQHVVAPLSLGDIVSPRPVDFIVEASSVNPLSYQWKENGTNLVGQTSATLSLMATNASAAGDYTVVISNSAGNVESHVATLQIESRAIDWGRKFWHPTPLRPGESYAGIAFGNGVMVAAGAHGLISASLDGEKWADVSPSYMYWSATQVRFLQGRFWIPTTDGSFMTSADGVNWDWRPTLARQRFNDVTWNNDVYVGVGNAGTIVKSTDGPDWSVISGFAGNPNFAGVTAGNGVFVAVTAATSEAFVSTNGSSWGRFSITNATTGYGVVFFKDRFVALLASGVYTSLDGISWSRAFATAYGIAVPSAFRLMLFAGDGSIAHTENAVDFTTETAKAPTGAVSGTFNGSAYYLVGSDIYQGYVAASLNGLSWLTLGQPLGSFGKPTVTFAGGRFYMGGAGGHANLPVSDGSDDWSQRATFHFVNGDFGQTTISGVAKVNDLFVAMTSFVNYSRERTWMSSDGMTFDVTPVAGPGTVTAVKFQEGEVLATGSAYGYRSTDGLAWRSDTFPVNLFSSAKGNSNVVVVGTGGYIARSVAGGAYQQVPSGSTQLLEGASYGDGKFVVVGNNVVLYSLDGARWFPGKKFFTTELTSVSYGDGLFLATGNGGTVASSWDGINWEQAQLHVGPDMFSAEFGNGRWVAAGRGGALLETGSRLGAASISLQGTLSSGQLVVVISAPAGTVVQLESTADLSSNSWQSLERLMMKGATTQRSFATSDAARFFRAVTE